jgi:hypothetical protein
MSKNSDKEEAPLVVYENSDDFIKSLGHHKKWFQFGLGSPRILYKRLRSTYQPIFHTRMMWQRAQRGWSIQDAWSFNHYLTDVIIGGVGQLLENQLGYPSTTLEDGTEMTMEKWSRILEEIITGMKAAKVREDEWKWEPGGEEAFNLAMDHLKKWWQALWD